jgi:hypothetical protein
MRHVSLVREKSVSKVHKKMFCNTSVIHVANNWEGVRERGREEEREDGRERGGERARKEPRRPTPVHILELDLVRACLELPQELGERLGLRR